MVYHYCLLFSLYVKYLELFQIVLGKCIPRPAPVDRTLANELHACAKDTDDFNTVLGTTLCADDFYEGKYGHAI